MDTSAINTETETMTYNKGLVGTLAELLGAPEPALRLLLSIFAGYPIVFIYRQYLVVYPLKKAYHIFFVFCGILLCIFNYGFDTYHSFIAISITYALVRLLHQAPHLLVILNFVFHMTYLLVGYYFTESENYDIVWTMPHCVLVLRLIGFGFDVADGRKPHGQLSKDQLETSLLELPTFLELCAFSYFPCSFLVGPQFSFKRYMRFICGEFRQYNGAIEAGVKRCALGLIYLVLRQIGTIILPDDYFLTDEYHNQPFFWRLIYLGLWGKLALYKYICCWMLAEGALICLGFTYVGKNSEGKNDWSGCTNVKLYLLETGFTMQHYVQSFNVNTNNWVAHYVYKRLKFLNNRTISYAAALSFLAVWHGFHSGYYMAFVIEYMIITVEKQIESMYKEAVLPKYGHILKKNLLYKCVKVFVLKAYNIIYMGWCLTPFIFLRFVRWQRVYSAVNYFGFIYIAFWYLVFTIYKLHTRKTSKILQTVTSKTLSQQATELERKALIETEWQPNFKTAEKRLEVDTQREAQEKTLAESLENTFVELEGKKISKVIFEENTTDLIELKNKQMQTLKQQ